MAMRWSVLLVSLLLLSLFLVSLGETREDPELRQCKQQCRQQQGIKRRQREECEDKCETYYKEKQREREEGGGRGEFNPQRQPEERLRECERQCESREEQHQPQCRRQCMDEYKREKQEEQGGGGGGHDNPRIDPQEELRECRIKCQRGREEQSSCERRCEKEFKTRQREREGEGEGNASYDRSEEEEGQERQQERENNPFLFEDQHFSTRVRTQHGRFRVLQRFTQRSKLLKGIENYRVAILEADPQTFITPQHCDTDDIFYVAQGRGSISLVLKDRRENFNLQRGDIMRVPAGSTVYFTNRDNNEKLVLAKLLRTISIPGRFESFYGAGGEDSESYYKAFSPEILEAAFDIKRDRIQRVFGKQREGLIVKASEEQIRALSRHEEEGTIWPFKAGTESKGPFNLLKKNPTHSNNYGRLHEADFNDYSQLEDLNVAVSFANITRGSMAGPSFNSEATKIAVVVEGEGTLEMACPHLSSSSEYQREREGRQGSQGQRQGGQRYQKVSARLTRGVVFISPAGHPTVTVASKNQNLQIVCFDVNAKNNHKFALAGKNNVINQWGKVAKELAFGVPAREIDEVFGKQNEEFFFKGPRQQQEGRADA